MTNLGPSHRAVTALLLSALALFLALPCAAEPGDAKDFAARQAETKKIFEEQVTPFVKASPASRPPSSDGSRRSPT